MDASLKTLFLPSSLSLANQRPTVPLSTGFRAKPPCAAPLTVDMASISTDGSKNAEIAICAVERRSARHSLVRGTALTGLPIGHTVHDPHPSAIRTARMRLPAYRLLP